MGKRMITTRFGRIIHMEAVERISKLIGKETEFVRLAIESTEAYNAFSVGVSLCRNFDLDVEKYAGEIRAIIHDTETPD
jgi:hypothetical protein